MHAKFLQVDGGKMSKSLGNVWSLDDVKARGFSPRALRYCLPYRHRLICSVLCALVAATMWGLATNPADAGRIVAWSLFGEVYVSEDVGESWRKIAREFGEIRTAAWLPA